MHALWIDNEEERLKREGGREGGRQRETQVNSATHAPNVQARIASHPSSAKAALSKSNFFDEVFFDIASHSSLSLSGCTTPSLPVIFSSHPVLLSQTLHKNLLQFCVDFAGTVTRVVSFAPPPPSPSEFESSCIKEKTASYQSTFREKTSAWHMQKGRDSAGERAKR